MRYLLILIFVLLFVPATSLAQEPAIDPQPLTLKNNFYIGKVTEVLAEREQAGLEGVGTNQTLVVKLEGGSMDGQEVTVPEYFAGSLRTLLKPGDKVVINEVERVTGNTYFVADRYRVWPAILIGLFFVAVVITFARWRGITAVLGLGFSFLVLIKLVVPEILKGTSPLLASLVGVFLIATISLYLAHGWNRRTTVALLATLATLVLAILMATFFVYATNLQGIGSDEALYLQLAPIGQIDLRGLLLGGIILGALGVLDDITTAQVAAVAEINRANPKLDFGDLYGRGLSVGREHIVSLVNTLVLAYVGASFPLLLLFALNTETQPLWVTLNSELIMEEVVRTLVGSTALVFAVPIATFAAVYAIKNRNLELAGPTGDGDHAHIH